MYVSLLGFVFPLGFNFDFLYKKNYSVGAILLDWDSFPFWRLDFRTLTFFHFFSTKVVAYFSYL